MWGNRWFRVGAVGVGFLLINALTRFVSFLVKPDEGDILATPAQGGVSAESVIAVVGELAVVALLAGAAVWWSVRHPAGRMVADLGIATIGGALLSLLIGPFAGGDVPFDGGLESFVLNFLQFVGLGALGILLGFAGTVVAGKDRRSRGLAAYAERHGRRPTPATNRRR